MIGPRESYPNSIPRITTNRRPVVQERVIDTANAEITVCELAERLTGPGVRRGRETHFICPLHDDHDPSLRVDPERGLWYCDPCAVGGDAVRLARLAWDHDRDDVAAAEVLLMFGHELPERPPSWFVKQKRQAPTRDGLGRIKEVVLRRRLFRLLEPMIAGISDTGEREREARFVWEELTPLAARMVRDGGE
jgi:hypothetical protein